MRVECAKSRFLNMRSIWGVMGLRKTRGRAAKPITKAFCLRDRSPQSSTPTTAEAVVCVRSEVCAVGEFLLADKTDDCGRDENRGGRLKGQDYVLMGIGDRSQTGDEQSPTVVGDIIQSESLRFHRLRAVASSWMTNIAREKEKTAMIPPALRTCPICPSPLRPGRPLRRSSGPRRARLVHGRSELRSPAVQQLGCYRACSRLCLCFQGTSFSE